jgi:hypothetical protein
MSSFNQKDPIFQFMFGIFFVVVTFLLIAGIVITLEKL